MKKVILMVLIAGVVVLGACKKADLLTYGSHDNVYLDLSDSQRDSLLYTFAYDLGKVADTMYIPVRLSGIHQNYDRKFILKDEQDSSTAKVNVHYKALDSVYYMKAGTGITYVPLILYNTDTLLQTRSVTLKLRLLATPDLDTAINALIFTKVVFSNKLERPDWWNQWFGDYYSSVKNQFFIITTGLTSLTTDGLDAPKNLYFVSLTTAFINDPFTWLKKNADKGYTMTQRPDGNYDFYSIAHPEQKIPYEKDPLSGLYYFIDENGNHVI